MAHAVLVQRLTADASALVLAFGVVFALLVLLALAALVGKAVRSWRTTSDRHDVGPDNLRLLQDLEAHLKASGASVADLYDTTTGD